jgi:hypothetical protein
MWQKKYNTIIYNTKSIKIITIQYNKLPYYGILSHNTSISVIQIDLSESHVQSVHLISQVSIYASITINQYINTWRIAVQQRTIQYNPILHTLQYYSFTMQYNTIQ